MTCSITIETVAALDFMLAMARRPAARAQLSVRSGDARRLGRAAAGGCASWINRRRRRCGAFCSRSRACDVAKPRRAPDETGRIRFFGHAERARRDRASCARRCASAAADRSRRDDGRQTPRRHSSASRAARNAARSIDSSVTPVTRPSQCCLSLADALAARGPGMTIEAWQGYVSYIGHILARRHGDQTIVRPVRLLTGAEIMDELDEKPGPEIGRLLASLEEAQASGEVLDRSKRSSLWGGSTMAPFAPES
jgi:hypothetical protein